MGVGCFRQVGHGRRRDARARAPRRRRPRRRASPRRSRRATPSRRGRTRPSAPPASPGRRARASPATSPTRSSRSGRAARTRTGEVKENLVDGSENSKWLVFEPHGLGRARARRAGQGRALRAHLRQRLGRARPARLDAPGLPRRQRRGPRSTRAAARTSPSASRPRSTPSPTPSPTGTTASTSPPTTATASSSSPSCSSPTATPPRRRPATCAASSAPARAAATTPSPASASPACTRCSTPAATPARAAATPTTRSSTSTCDVTRRTRAVVPDLSRLRARRPQLPEHVRRRRPRLHRRHLPQRPRGEGPARRDAEPAGPGRLARRSTRTSGTSSARASARVAAGKTIDRILVAYDNPDGPADFGGWIDDIDVGPAEPRARAQAPLRLGRHDPRHELERLLLARQQHPRHRGAARLQLLDAGHRRRQRQLALRVPEGQQRGQPADAAGVLAQPRAEPVDGRPPDLPGHADGRRPGRRTPTARPARCRSGTPNETAQPHYYGVRFQNGIRTRDRAHRPRRDHALLVPRRLVEPDLRQRRPEHGDSSLTIDRRQRRDHGLVGRRAAASPTARRGCSSTPPSTSRSRRAGC